MSEKKKPTWEDAEKICEGFQSLKEALLKIEPYGIQWKALELLKEAREEASFALLFADAENPFLTDEARNRMKREYLEREANRLRALSIERQGGHEMTKREICERLIKTRDYLAAYEKLLLKDNCPFDADDLGACADTIRDLLLDLAAPEEVPKAEEKHPGVIAKPGKDGEIEFCWCQKCYAQAAVVHDPFGDGENWSYCKKCGVSFRLKREEEADK